MHRVACLAIVTAFVAIAWLTVPPVRARPRPLPASSPLALAAPTAVIRVFLPLLAGAGTVVDPVPPSPTNAPMPILLWAADMETGDLSQWNDGGGEFNSGSYSTGGSREVAHTGAYSARLTITTPPETGVRLFRWKESRTYSSLYYSTWYWFPEYVSAANYWNIMQWKSKTGSANDPFYTLNVLNTGGAMRLYLYDWQRKVSLKQSSANLPIGRWVHIQAFYQCTGDGNGKITIWQDGQAILQDTGKSTRYANGDCQWSVDNYSDRLTPSPTTIYIDDAAISQEFIP
jgi:hypothetical protein